MPRLRLTKHQLSALRLLEQGHNDEEIASELALPAGAVGFHLATIPVRIAGEVAAQLSDAMIPGEDLRAQQRILEDIFMHAAAHSRTCDSISERVQRCLRPRDGDSAGRVEFGPQQAIEFSEGIGHLEMAVRDLCAKIAPVAVERARLLANIYPDPDQQLIFDLEGERLDKFLRPIFIEAGLASDLMTEAELKALRRGPASPALRLTPR